MRIAHRPFISFNRDSGKAGWANTRLGLLFQIVVALLVLVFNAPAQPVVSNVRVAQRAGSGLVDIYYDLASASNSLTVSVVVSTNSGVTFNVPAKSVSGDVGSGVTPGTSKHIVWNAGADLAGLYFPNVKVRVTADDGSTPPAPSGMVLIPAGSFEMGDSLGNSGTNSGALPFHTVYISAFHMDQYDVAEALRAQEYNWATNHGYSFDGDGGTNSDELPFHTVYISAFYMDQYDVTEALWAQVYNWATNHGYSFGGLPWSVSDGYTKGPNYPVVDVNWYDCV